MDKTQEALERFLRFLKHQLKGGPKVQAEAREFLNEYIFHSFSDVRNESMHTVRHILLEARGHQPESPGGRLE